MNFEKLVNKITGTDKECFFMVPSDSTCHSFAFHPKLFAIGLLNDLNDKYEDMEEDTEYSITPMGNVSVWDDSVLKQVYKECYRIDMVNDHILKFYEYMRVGGWANN